MTKLRFAVIGINHAHIHGQIDCLLRAGAELVGFHAPENDLAKSFAERYPQALRASDRRRLLEDATIPLIVSAGIPFERAPLGIEVMRHGKDYMTDKPGMTSLEQLAEVRRVRAETGPSARSSIRPASARTSSRTCRVPTGSTSAKRPAAS
jgi:predicted dehydrogenase